MDFFPAQKNSQTISALCSKFFDMIQNAEQHIAQSTANNGLYHLDIQPVSNGSRFLKPDTFELRDFPPAIISHVNAHIKSALIYTVPFMGRTVVIRFLTEHAHINMQSTTILTTYDMYVKRMLIWLKIAYKYSTAECINDLSVVIYHTSLKKTVSNASIDVLGQNHANTAFTRTCAAKPEIVIYRTEEWFKSFIHESFHSLHLDFSGTTDDVTRTAMLALFAIQSDVKLYEAYTECWARIINVFFFSYSILDDASKTPQKYTTNVYHFLQLERMHAMFQMVKVLDYMELNYLKVVSSRTDYRTESKELYKEGTSIFAYYVVTSILLFNMHEFIDWCAANNPNTLNFKKTRQNLIEFCDFIKSKYKLRTFTNVVKKMETMYDDVYDASLATYMEQGNNRNCDSHIFTTNMRMSCCELL